MKSRAFGWVQDPGKIENLRRTVEVFDDQSSTYHELINELIPTLIEERDGRNCFISELKRTPLKLKYTDLKGTAFTPRKDSRCNGIIQALIKGQKREFIGDWPADNFIRWAHVLGFIHYDSNIDSFSITKFGLQYTRTQTGTSD